MQAIFTKQRTRWLLLALTLLLLALAALLGPLVLSDAQVVRITPAEGTQDANPQAGVRIEFSQWVRPQSVAAVARIEGADEGDISAEAQGTTVVLRPAEGLEYGQDYTLVLDGQASNILGRSFAISRTLDFATVPYRSVTSTTPADDAREVALRGPISITFNEPVIGSDTTDTPGPQVLELSPPVAGTGHWLTPRLYNFYPDEYLSPSTTYTATVRANLTSDGKMRLAEPVTWNFKTTAPLLASTRPHDGARNVRPDSAIDVRLDAVVDAASASQHFQLTTAQDSGEVTGTIELQDNGFRFVPDAPLQRDTRYRARLGAGIQAQGGATLNNRPITWEFTTLEELEVARVVPPLNRGDVPTDTQHIRVHFNHPIDLDAAPGDLLRFSPALPGSGSWRDTSTYVFSPTVPLTPATRYTASLAPGLRDQTGSTLDEPYRWVFTTLLPRVVEFRPADGAQYADPDGPIEIVFNQPIDPVSIAAGTLQLRNTNTDEQVFGTFALEGNTATFQPAEPLQRGATYELTIGQRARAAASDEPLVGQRSATFEVAPQPRLLSTSPATGTTEADTNSRVMLEFNTPMDWASVEQHLTIEPQPATFSTWHDETRLYVSFAMRPETGYRVALDAGAQDQYGTPLREDVALAFQTTPPPPELAVALPQPMGQYNALDVVRVPLRYSSLQRITYQLYRLEAAQTAALASGSWDDWDDLPEDALVRSDEISLESGEGSRQGYYLLELPGLETGTYALAVDSVPDKDLPPQHSRSAPEVRHVMAVSPYATMLKRSTDDRLFVWAVDMNTGEPAADLPLYAATFDYDSNFLNADSGTLLGRTDADGVLKTTFPREGSYENLVVWSAPADGDTSPEERFAFTTNRWDTGLHPYAFDLPYSWEPDRLLGSITTDRPIYRPDQTVHIHGVLRLEDGSRYVVPEEGRRAYLSIKDPQDNMVFGEALELSEFGAFHADLELGRDAPLGTFVMTVSLEDDPHNEQFRGTFSVAEYRKPTFEVNVSATDRNLVRGDTLEMQVDASYYFGGAVADAPVQWRLLSYPLDFESEAASEYRFEDSRDAYAWYRRSSSEYGYGGELVGNGEATTDEQGRFRLRLPSDVGEEEGSRRFVLDAEITDVDGQAIAAQGTVNVHAGAFYVGLKTRGYVGRSGEPQTVDLRTVDIEDQPEGQRDVTVGVYQRTWYSIRERSATGHLAWASNYTETLVYSQTVTTDERGQASVTFTPDEGGSYRIGAEGQDSAGNPIRASAYTWVYGGDGGTFWGISDNNRIDLVADQDTYEPGDTASILVAAPYSGMRGLLTIERGDIIEHRTLDVLDTSTLLEVPISADYAPNVYVSLVLVKPTGEDGTAADVRVGMLELPVSSAQQALNISITPDVEQAAPGDEVTYTIRATDHTGAGVRAELAVALVDKAVLALADDPNPTLMQAFYEQRPLAILTAHSLTALVDRVTQTLEPGTKGGGGGLAADVLLRRDFPDTVYWNPSVMTNEDGEAQVTLTLPDALTTWRLSVRGVGPDTRVGQAGHDLVANRPLMVRAALPRFLSVGDEPLLRAIVHNATSQPMSATITLDPGVLDLDAPAQQTVEIAAASETVVTWPASVGSELATLDSAQEATLRFSAEGRSLAEDSAAYQDAVEHVLPLQRYHAPDIVVSSGQVQDSASISIDPTEVLQHTRIAATQGSTQQVQGELELELTPSLLAGMEQGLTYLEHYPHGCTEQTMSRFFPNAAIAWLLDLMGVEDASLLEQLQRNLQRSLQRIYTLQHLDGGWGWWEQDDSQPYISAYVLHGLLTVQQAGYTVDEQVLADGLAYLQDSLDTRQRQRAHSADLSNARLTARAYTLFVLAEAGQPEHGRTIALYDERDELSLDGQAYLLMALERLDETRRVQTLANELMSQAMYDGELAYWEMPTRNPWTMSSTTRTTALAAQALVRADPSSPLAGSAIRYLMQQRQGGHWRTTQESATSLLALADYAAESGTLSADYSYVARLDGRTLYEGTASGENLDETVRLRVALDDLRQRGQSRLSIQRQDRDEHTGHLYYSLRMRAYQDAASVQPRDEGLQVQREYIAIDQATLQPTGQPIHEVPLGDVVQVRLTLTVPEQAHYLAVEDMLPAGLEPLDASLNTVSALADEPQLARAASEDDQYPWSRWWNVTRSQVHDNQVALFSTTLSSGTYHYTYLARATTVGTFQAPPARAYEMYAPQVNGNSAGGQLVVTE